MRQRTQHPSFSKKYLDTALKTKSWESVARNGWIIKFSVYEGIKVLLTIVSQHTGQVIVRYFSDEDGKPVTKLYISGKGEGFEFTPTSLEENKGEIVTLLQNMYNNTNAI